MLIETKIQIKEQRLKEMTELVQMITISSSDNISATCTPSVAPPTQDTSFVEKSSPGPTDKKQFQQVPQFTITTEDDNEEEEDESQANDQYNDQLNKVMVHPVAAAVDNSGVVDSATDFVESDNQKELGNGKVPVSHKHYHLEMDGQDQQSHQPKPRNSHLETSV